MYSNILHYVKTGELKEFKTKEEAEEFSKFAVESLITGGGDSIRERVTVELVHGEHLPGKHGWDGRLGNTMLEIKNETISKATDKKQPCVSGRGRFNNISWKSFKKYQEDEGLYISAGYSRDGILLYALAFDMKHLLPKLRKALEDGLGTTGLELGNVGVTISASDFPDELEVIYLPDTIKRSNYSSRLLHLLINNEKTKLRTKRLSTPPYKRCKIK